MAKRYISPLLLDGTDTGDTGRTTKWSVFHIDSTRNLKEDDIATSFVYGDDNYEEDYVVPDVVEEVTAAPAEASGDSAE